MWRGFVGGFAGGCSRTSLGRLLVKGVARNVLRTFLTSGDLYFFDALFCKIFSVWVFTYFQFLFYNPREVRGNGFARIARPDITWC